MAKNALYVHDIVATESLLSFVFGHDMLRLQRQHVTSALTTGAPRAQVAWIQRFADADTHNPISNDTEFFPQFGVLHPRTPRAVLPNQLASADDAAYDIRIVDPSIARDGVQVRRVEQR